MYLISMGVEMVFRFYPGTKRTTLNAFGEPIHWIGRWTEHEYKLWLKCETEDHLRSGFYFQVAQIHEKLALATGRDHGWPKAMPWQLRLSLFLSYKSGWTPKRSAYTTIGMSVHQVMDAFRDLEEWAFAHEKEVFDLIKYPPEPPEIEGALGGSAK
jgi:hypothetical protein